MYLQKRKNRAYVYNRERVGPIFVIYDERVRAYICIKEFEWPIYVIRKK
jgi:hypothetical protein